MKRFLTILTVVIVAIAGFAVGRMTGDSQILNVNAVKRVFPMLPAPPRHSDQEATNVPAKPAEPDKDIVLEVPVDQASLSGTFEVSGRARSTGQEVVVDVKDASGQDIFQGQTAVEADSAGSFGRFSQTVTLPQHQLGQGTVAVYFEGADAQPESPVSRAVTFVEPDTVAVKVYFRMAGFDAPAACDTVQPVERTVSSKAAVYRAVIDELIKGPTDAEKAAGYSSALPASVTLKSVAADADGVVTADFTGSLLRGVSGSCRLAALRAQIVSTLKQFPEVRDVVIAINGRIQEAL